MQKLNNKIMAAIIAIILLTSMAIAFNELLTANAYGSATQTAIDQGMHWTGMTSDASATRLLLWNRFHDKIPTHCYLMIAPNPVGIGQTFNIVMFNPQLPPSASMSNDVRWTYKLKFDKPDGTSETVPAAGTSTGNTVVGGSAGGVFISDSTGSTYTAYTPDQLGNYTLTVYYQETYYRWNSTTGGSNDYYGITFLASSYTTVVTVQQEPVTIHNLPIIPALPFQYWTRPIEGQNTNWYQVSSNWYGNCRDSDYLAGSENRFQPDGIAPNSPHILWTRPTEDNGIVGGTRVGREGTGNAFNAGSQYQPRWNSQVIMYGRLYYTPNVIYSGTSELLDCVDLKTGQLIYEINTTAATGRSNVPNFGYYYSDDNPNEHGIANPGWLFTTNYGIGYQPERGLPYLHLSNVPSGFETQGVAGENIRYTISNITNTGGGAQAKFSLTQWNSTVSISSRSPTQSTVMANVPTVPSRPTTALPSGYTWYWNATSWQNVTSTTLTSQSLATTSSSSFDWNITMPWTFTAAPTIDAAKVGDMIWGYNGSWPTGSGSPSYAYPDAVTIWAVSLKPGSEGSPIYMRNLTLDDPIANTNNILQRSSVDEGVFVTLTIPTCSFNCYNIRTGDLMWSSDKQTDDLNPYGYYTWPSLISETQTKIAYDILFTGGYTGSVSAYALANGSLLWRYTAPSGGEKINNFVLMEGLICDGKIFIGTHEHSADTPLYKGERVRCLNATTGDVLWTMAGWAYPMTFATADGVVVYWNNYDAQVYALGKGPSAMTITAPDIAPSLGTPIAIKGTVTDISAGTQQSTVKANFPYGVPAVSDASQSQWMEYVYMQKGQPTNTTGVPISIDVVDSNGNYRNIGHTTSDSYGTFSLSWTPDITGPYSVIASFAGSESYWPSQAKTTFDVAAAPPTASPYPVVNLPPTEMYIAAAAAATIIAIAIAAVLIVLMLRKRP